MTGKELNKALHDGTKVFGTVIVSTSPRWIDVVAQMDMDFVFIDTEHIPIDREMLSWMCHAYKGIGKAPIVRIPSPDPFQASMVLDGGASGVIAPYVETADEVRALVGAVKYRPLKGDRLKKALEKPETLEPALTDYLTDRNADKSLIVNIESTPALDALDDILAVPGLDAVLVGPHDLTCNLGIPEQYNDKRYISAVDTIISKARAAHIGAGCHVIYPDGLEQEIRWAKQGMNFIIHSADLLAFSRTISRDINEIRQSKDD